MSPPAASGRNEGQPTDVFFHAFNVVTARRSVPAKILMRLPRDNMNVECTDGDCVSCNLVRVSVESRNRIQNKNDLWTTIKRINGWQEVHRRIQTGEAFVGERRQKRLPRAPHGSRRAFDDAAKGKAGPVNFAEALAALSEDERFAVEERAALHEYDGRLDRDAAERLAISEHWRTKHNGGFQ